VGEQRDELTYTFDATRISLVPDENVPNKLRLV